MNSFFLTINKVLLFLIILLCPYFAWAFYNTETEEEKKEIEETKTEITTKSQSNKVTKDTLSKTDDIHPPLMLAVDSTAHPLHHLHHDDSLAFFHHYDILHDECYMDPDMFSYSDHACDENPYIETMKADTLFWKKISKFYTTFDTKNVNPYMTNHHEKEFLNDTFKLILYDTSLLEKQWSMPLELKNNYVTSTFKYRSWQRRWHKGTDVDLITGDSVFAVFDGVVRISSYNPGGYGHYVLIRHYNGLETVYGHFSKRYVCPGQPVKAGDLIGLGGNTGGSRGSHLHFETRFRGVAFDSEFIFDYKNQKIKSHEITIYPKFFAYLGVGRSSPVSSSAKYSSGSKVYHRIRSGDTLGAIARRYRTYVSTICMLNGIRSSTILRIGKVLRVK